MSDSIVAEALRGSSFEQKHILKTLLSGMAHGHDWFGVGWANWYPSKGPSAIECGWTRADSATVSRSLRRLADRGLVERCNHATGTTLRTTAARLTPLGVAAAERLTKCEPQNVNRYPNEEPPQKLGRSSQTPAARDCVSMAEGRHECEEARTA